VAVENAIAFQEIEALKDQLAKENAYLKEARTEHNFGELNPRHRSDDDGLQYGSLHLAPGGRPTGAPSGSRGVVMIGRRSYRRYGTA
jgi:hypothetical protein